MKAKLLIFAMVCFLSVGLYSIPVIGGSFEDLIQSTYIYINLKNYVTSALPTAASRGRIAYDSTVDQAVVDDTSAWGRLLSSTKHLETTQTTAPTLEGCAGTATMNTGSTDANWSFTTSATTRCAVKFAIAYTNRPFCTVTQNSVDATLPRVATLTTARATIASFSNVNNGGETAEITGICLGRYS